MSGPTIVRPSVFQSPVRRTRLLLASLPLFAGLLSESGEVLECNFGPLGTPIDGRTDWIGRSFETGPWWNYSEESRADILIMLGRAQRGEKVSKERLYRSADGEMGVMLLTLTPLFAPYGQPDAILVTAVDVTERRRESETAEHIAHDLAHRLRNSFTVMRTLATHTDAEETGRTLSDRLNRVREGHSLSYRYLFFGVPIQDVVEASVHDPAKLASYRFDPVSVPSDHVETLMLALGELSRRDVQADLVALKQGDDRMRLTWTEPTPRETAEMPTGLSLALLTAVPEQKTGGTVAMVNGPDGFSWTFDFPFIHPDLDDAGTG
ncbi:MAG: PAS domain-containing protein [Litorimonas sp.]